MLLAILCFHDQIINVTFNRLMDEAIKDHSHSTLISRARIFEAKCHDSVVEIPFGRSKSCIECILWVHLNLVITRKTIHEGQGAIAGGSIYYHLCDGNWKIILRTSTV